MQNIGFLMTRLIIIWIASSDMQENSIIWWSLVHQTNVVCYPERLEIVENIARNDRKAFSITGKSQSCPFFTERTFGGDNHYDVMYFLSEKECAAVCYAEALCFSVSFKDSQCYLYSEGEAPAPVLDPASIHMVQVCNYGKSYRGLVFVCFVQRQPMLRVLEPLTVWSRSAIMVSEPCLTLREHDCEIYCEFYGYKN